MTLRIIACLLCGGFLSACGWQLRGGLPFNTDQNTKTAAIENLSILSENRNNAFFRALLSTLSKKKITVTQNANLVLQVSPEELSRQPLAYTRTGVPAQYKLQIDLTYQVSKNGEVLIPQRRLISRRNYDFDADLIIAKDREQEELLKEMRNELSQRILGSIQRAVR